jgi:ribonuclease HI
MMSVKNLIIHADGASRGNPGPAAIGVVIEDEQGRVVARISKAIGIATNNRAEYLALIAGLKEALKLGAESAELKMDSELIVRQLTGKYRVRNPALKPLFMEAFHLLKKFESSSIQHIPREQNRAADALCRQALRSAGN